jgi:hypothetical protein
MEVRTEDKHARGMEAVVRGGGKTHRFIAVIIISMVTTVK